MENVLYRGIEIEIKEIPYGYRYTYTMTDKAGNDFIQTWDMLTHHDALVHARQEIDANLASDSGRAFN